VAALNGVDIAGVQGSGAKGRVRRSDVEATLASARSGRWDAGLEIEPRARRAARELDIDLRRIAAGKPGQRIVEADVRAFAIPAPAPHPCEVEVPAIPVTEGYTEQRHSAMRRVIAARLTESKQTVPHFYLVAHCEIDRLLDARVRVNGAFPEARVSVNDFVILAMARALELVPDANVGWTETAMRHYATVDIAMAVATDGGLITPIIRRASTKSLRVIAAETKDLAARARAGRLASQDYEGGSASVSNLGMFGTEEFCAIINPPQACILAVGAGSERPVARDGALAVATVMTCTLSVDHRAIDGAVAARLLAAFKEMIENPAALLS
jgi:pyruvate dehydrogenase E2 component (dihydrolipoamide acetyltransferase)